MAKPETITPRPEPEVIAAQVREMLTPFFKGDLGPEPAMNHRVPQRPAPAAAAEMELA